MRKKALVSACLLGERVRYDGAAKENIDVIKALEEYEIIPFCPESPLFGTPREKISLHVKGDTVAVISDETQKDVTALLEGETQKYIDMHLELDLIVLKSKSPSCGIQSTKVKNSNTLASGISADMFKQAYPKLLIVDENYFKECEC